jgi:hypothetical protein
MSQHTCPNCGFSLPPQVASKGGGNPALPADLRIAGARAGETPVKLGDDLIGWRGMVWSTSLARKAAVCWITGAEIKVSAKAWRPITNGQNRPRRVSAAAWAHIA